MIPLDYHMHTHYSCDSKATMAAMCQSAIFKGVPEIGITEHLDHHPKDTCSNFFKLEAWAAELEQCRAQFAGQLALRAGIEVGEPHRFGTQAQATLTRYPFDYVLGSLHWVGDDIVFDPKVYERQAAREAFAAYYAELEQLVRHGDFDILSHFDVPVRTAYKVYSGYVPTEFEDLIRPVLKACVERGKALDINTALLRRGVNILTPGLAILRWYVELGGERVTLGSDAHKPEHVALGLDVALATAREAGLKYVTQFERRQARMLAI